MALTAKSISNMIQGVSQQSPQQRRDTQCEAQYDCLNSSVDGCVARPHGDYKGQSATDFTGAWFTDIQRSRAEHYLLAIKNNALAVFDLEDMTPCTITYRSYLLSVIVADNAGNTETVTIDGKVYTFQTSLTNTDGHVKIGADRDATLKNLAAAVTLGAGAGTTYATATTLHPTVTARWLSTGLMLATSNKSDAITVSEATAHLNWSADQSYFANLTPADNFAACTIDDNTFIGNKSIKAVMLADLSPLRPPEALLNFRAGNYLTKYQVAIIYQGIQYQWSYTTPDNSVSGNGAFITTQQLAATFYRALTGSAAVPPTSGDDDVGLGVGAGSVGDAGGGGDDGGIQSVVSADITATSLGFSVSIKGNVLRIWRASDTDDFDIDVSDGNGGDMLKGIKGVVEDFGDLPYQAFDGFVVKVRGANEAAIDDYYVSYVNGDAQGSGFWEECVAPGTQYLIDDGTMPYRLINTDFRTFTFGRTIWEERVAGDGVNTALDPTFIGRFMEDLAFDNSRLAIVLEGGVSWSKTQNPFVFFPATVQTALDDDPMNAPVAGTKQASLLRKLVHHDEETFAWAEQQQHKISTDPDPFRQSSLRIKPSSFYEFSDLTTPLSLGPSLYFVTDNGSFIMLRDLFISNGKALGDTEVTAHVPSYIPSGARWISGSDAARCLFVTSDAATDRLWLYNFLIQDNNRLQSAWNVWRIPSGAIVWAGVYRKTLKLLVVTPDTHTILLHYNLERGLADDEWDQTNSDDHKLTRVDWRVTEADCDPHYTAGQTTYTLPYVTDILDGSRVFVVERDGAGRGTQYPVTGFDGQNLTLAGDTHTKHLYIGLQIDARRQESEFYLRSDAGNMIAEDIRLKRYALSLSASGYSRVEVTVTPPAKTLSYVFTKTGLANGEINAPVEGKNTDTIITVINDSFKPSAWQSSKYLFSATFFANAVPDAPPSAASAEKG